MKQIFFFLVLVFCGVEAVAQPVAGKFILGGNINLNIENGDDIKDREIGISPLFGYTLNTKNMIGISAGFGYRKYSDNSDPDMSRSQVDMNYQFTPFYRYYFIAQKAGLFMEATGSFKYAKSEMKSVYTDIPATTIEMKGNITDISVGLAPGIYYQITPGIFIESKLGFLEYHFLKSEQDDESYNTNLFGLDLSTSLSLGILFAL